jgi:hypothetical protein
MENFEAEVLALRVPNAKGNASQEVLLLRGW